VRQNALSFLNKGQDHERGTPVITIFQAKKIITMNPARPEATHVAVRDGMIIGTGTLKELSLWGQHELNKDFADKILMPGLVEGHSHTMEGTLWRYTYCGYFDRVDPNGKTWMGLKDIDAVLDRLKDAEQALEDPNAPLPGWQIDPIYFGNRRVTRADLDHACFGSYLERQYQGAGAGRLAQAGRQSPRCSVGERWIAHRRIEGSGNHDPGWYTRRL
jgi:hypothetical protein